MAALLRLERGVMVMITFGGCIGSLIGSLLAFLGDINLSLSALKLEVSHEETGVIVDPATPRTDPFPDLRLEVSGNLCRKDRLLLGVEGKEFQYPAAGVF